MKTKWKNNLLNLPDSIFFEIMRNFLGEIKTPFNKHDLINTLYALVYKKEVRSRIFSLIDDEDSQLLTAIALLEDPDLEELSNFTSSYYSFLELHNRISNLQERLLICIEYPAKNNRRRKKTIKLSPIFEAELKKDYLDTSLIFNSLEITKVTTNLWLTKRLIAAFLSFLSAEPDFFKTSGHGKKKAESAFSELFKIETYNSNYDIK
ncbi:MAG: hypothetical protein PQJ46_16895, partial [Spirochaetales bacterium]|nr:hypothetical protein [Spirochaetales bacterium]